MSRLWSSVLQVQDPKKSSISYPLAALDAIPVSKDPNIEHIHLSKWPLSLVIAPKLPMFDATMISLAIKKYGDSLCYWNPTSLAIADDDQIRRYELVMQRIMERKLVIFAPIQKPDNNQKYLIMFPLKLFDLLKQNKRPDIDIQENDPKYKHTMISVIVDLDTIQKARKMNKKK